MHFTQSLTAAALALALSGLAHAGVTAEEAKKLGTTLTPIGAEKPGNKAGDDSRVHRRPHHAARRLQAGRRHPARPVRRREAALLDRREEHGAVRGAANRGREGADEGLPDLPDGRLQDAPHRRVPEVRARQHRRERDAGEDDQRRPLDAGRARGVPVPDPAGRLRGDVEPPGAVQRPEPTRRSTATSTSTPAAGRRSPPKG